MRVGSSRSQRLGAGGLAVVVALWTCLVCVPAAAKTDDVDRYLTAAVRLYEDLEYERALEQLGRARKLSRGVDDDVTIALYEGIILADLGRKDASIAAFKEGLYLKPDAKLPLRVSPKVSREFENVRAEVKKELAPILAKREAERRAREAEDKAAQERARAEKEKRDAEAKRNAEAAKRQAEEKRQAALAEQHAGSTGDSPTREPHLIDARPDGATQTDPGGLASSTVAEPARAGPPVLPLALGGVAVATAGAGAFFGMQSRGEIDAARASAFRPDAQAHLQAAQTPALVANVLFAAAATAAAGAVIALVTGGADEAPAPATEAAVAAP